MMGEVLLLALLLGSAGAAVSFVLMPLLPRRTAALGLAPVRSASVPSNEGALSSLEELELDFQMGKLEEADYRTFRKSLVAVAGDVIDERATRERLELLVEAEVARRRSLLGAPGSDRTTPSPLQEVGEGGRRPVPATARAANRRALVAAGVAAGLFLTATGILVADQLGRQTGQRPVATLEAGRYTTLAFAAGDPTRLLAGSNEGLRASADEGRSWSLTTISGNVRAIVAHPTAAAPGGMLAAGDRILARSSDGGLTWSAVTHDLPGTDIRALALDPRNPDRVYAVVEGHGLFE
ncbi:MAG: exo-alpha-sialidase, partial [Chloroflexi bacterium]|nr:exo-alpha-sialidase [Chloroflexota bacterium]